MNSIVNFRDTSINAVLDNIITKVLFANALIIIGAKISVPFYPVPLSLQTLAILGISVFAGRNVAVLSTIFYLLEGFMGLPVCTNMETGPSMFIGTRAGYLLGFIALAYISGMNKEILKNSFLNSVVVQFMGLLALFALGVSYLSTFIGLKGAITFGLTPFIFGEICKVILVAQANNLYQKHR